MHTEDYLGCGLAGQKAQAMKKFLFALFALFLPGIWGGDMSALSGFGQWLNRPLRGDPEPQRIDQQGADAQHDQQRAAQPREHPHFARNVVQGVAISLVLAVPVALFVLLLR
jgi:hypothetical protein